MKNKTRLCTVLLIALTPFMVKLSKDLYKMGLRDGKAHVQSTTKHLPV